MRLFGYIISVEKRQKNIERKLSGPICKVVADDQFLFLETPDSVRIPKQLSIEIIESVHSAPRARVELYVDITELLKK